ncbi:hypothetical protein BEV13_05775 [Rickettsiella grylli]|uniref:RnfH family protein n=1 Tax=Rickettsiella grylli TaxID=59196 RepID=UPI0008FD86C3|nr:RnfH family protein [Rickettsiella grylli]OIZ99440.1 hypothetical protein BEV13_05775 [Rickettsiella grylli]
MPFFQVDVVFADRSGEKIISILVPPNTCILAAIKLSGILLHFPQIHFKKNKVGIFGKLCTLDTPVNAGDRIEIYQPLLIDPKKIRANRAQKQKTSPYR